MLSFRYSLVASLLAALTIAVGRGPTCDADENDTAAAKEQQLIRVLQSDASKADKAITCKQLAIWGTADAVPALAALLPDEELTSWSRIALEAIPDPAAAAALREALATLQGRTLIGVINSIGVRGDAEAVDGLTTRLKDADAEVASAAAVALGKIGDAAATGSLRRALSDAPDAVRSAVAEGCVLCAERLLADGKTAEAAALYDEVRQADVPKQRVVEATRGAILARQAAGVSLLVEQLKSGDKSLVAIGLSTARELSGPGVTKALVAELDNIAPAQQALLILALADRGDAEAMPAMLQAAKSKTSQVRIAAVNFLKQLGDESCVSVLLQVATDDETNVAQAAKTALEALAGDGVDADLASRLEQARGKERQVLIELVGRRRIAAVPALLAAVEDADPQIRAAALTALGEVATLDDLSVLITRVVAPPHAEDTQVAQQALSAACVRMPQREACAEKLAAALVQAPLPAKVAILETLSAMGGATALQTVGAAAKDPDPQLQDTATRLLGSWMTVDAAPVLLDLAKAPSGKYKVRALRGYLRLPRQFSMTEEQRVAMCRNALQAAERDEERKLVLEVIERYPSIDMYRLAVEASRIPSLKHDAAAVALAVAQKIGGSADVQALLEQLGQKPVKIEIIQAQYGAGTTQKDVTEILRRHVRDLPLIVLPSSSYNSAFGGDPAPGVVKQLKVQYRMDGQAGEAVFTENATIMLPMPK
jgi:HEAT repeat protein